MMWDARAGTLRLPSAPMLADACRALSRASHAPRGRETIVDMQCERGTGETGRGRKVR